MNVTFFLFYKNMSLTIDVMTADVSIFPFPILIFKPPSSWFGKHYKDFSELVYQAISKIEPPHTIILSSHPSKSERNEEWLEQMVVILSFISIKWVMYN